MAEIADVADALVAFLEAEAFSAPYAEIRPERLYDPDYRPDQLASLKVSVVGVDWSQDLGDKDSDDQRVTVGVALQKYTDGSRRQMDELVRLAREVARACLRADLDALGAHAVSATFDPLYSVPKLREESVFWSGILVTFELMEDGA